MEHTNGQEEPESLKKVPAPDPHFLVVVLGQDHHFFEFADKFSAQLEARRFLQQHWLELENDSVYLLITPVSPVTFMVMSKEAVKNMFAQKASQAAPPAQQPAKTRIVAPHGR